MYPEKGKINTKEAGKGPLKKLSKLTAWHIDGFGWYRLGCEKTN